MRRKTLRPYVTLDDALRIWNILTNMKIPEYQFKKQQQQSITSNHAKQDIFT